VRIPVVVPVFTRHLFRAVDGVAVRAGDDPQTPVFRRAGSDRAPSGEKGTRRSILISVLRRRR
jgi:hypothetical protein